MRSSSSSILSSISCRISSSSSLRFESLARAWNIYPGVHMSKCNCSLSSRKSDVLMSPGVGYHPIPLQLLSQAILHLCSQQPPHVHTFDSEVLVLMEIHKHFTEKLQPQNVLQHSLVHFPLLKNDSCSSADRIPFTDRKI